MNRASATAVLLVVLAVLAPAAGTLQIFFIDVEGGQSTLMITPAGESLLIDAGYGGRFGGRDPDRILEVMREAHIDRLDYLLVTHFHPDHAGGIPELAAKVPIGTFIDYGEPLGFDRMTTGSFRAYEPIRSQARHIQALAGDLLPFEGIEARVVSSGGTLIAKPLDGGGEINEACVNVENHPEDGTENFRSLGVMFRFGRFRFLDLGDLSGNTLTSAVCPRNLLGTASVYLISHHGDYDTNVPALYAAVRPRVAIMNNGVRKGGEPEAFKTLKRVPGLEDLWQLHESRNPRAANAPSSFIANTDEGATSYWLKLTATDDGGFQMMNARTGFFKTYPQKPH